MRLRRLGILVVTLSILAPTTSWTQIIESRRVFGRYQQFVWNDQYGLPQNAPQSVVRTRDGYLWVGTVEGAARFDGMRFTVFDRSNTPLQDSTVMAMLEDREGALWMGTQAGIARVENRRFTWLSSEGIADDHINAILESDGALWFATYRSGILRFENGRFTAITTADGLPHNQVWTLARDADGRLWAGTSAGLAVREGGRFKIYTTTGGLPDDIVRAVHRDRDGRLWVGTDGGIAWLDGDRFTRPAALSRIGAPISAFLETRDGAIWIATRGEGLHRYVRGVLSSYRIEDGLPDDILVSLYQDPDGDVWVGTYGWGLVQLREPRVEIVTTQNGLAHNTAQTVFEDRDGAIWIGTDAGLNRLADGVITTFRAETVVARVNAIAQDGSGQVWVGTRRGVGRVRDGRIDMLPELPALAVMAMLADREGNLWAASLNDGLYKIKNGRIDAHLTVRDGLPANELLALHEDAAGALWIGTFNRGMSRLENGQLTTWTMHDGLASNYILSFCEDGSGALWIGTHGGGLHRFKDGRFSVITTAHGLYDNLAFEILDDERGNLWMLGNRGIYRATLQSLNDVADGKAAFASSFAYGVADGMLSREGNDGGPSAAKARDGRIWFATMGGAVAIDPGTRNETPPKVAIEGVTIDRVAAPAADAIQMSPEQENIEIHYTGFSWLRPQQMRFRYRLSGLDRDWVEAGSRRTAYYSHLPPGRYTFQVIADNGDGVWNMDGQTLAVTVLPAFYQQRWFLPLISISIGLVVASGWRYRMGQVRARQAAQQAFARQLIASQETERKRIAAELHDGLGQHLVVIKNLALLTLNQEADASERRQRIEDISDGASQAIREVREISHNLRPYQLDRLGLTLALQAIVKTAHAGSPVAFTTAIENIDDVFSKEGEINLYRVVQESVNNIVKHAQASAASVAVRRDGARLLVTIADNGRGFDAMTPSKDPQKGGFGLLGISERVHLLGGAVRVESASGRGTVVSIDIGLEDVTRGR